MSRRLQHMLQRDRPAESQARQHWLCCSARTQDAEVRWSVMARGSCASTHPSCHVHYNCHFLCSAVWLRNCVCPRGADSGVSPAKRNKGFELLLSMVIRPTRSPRRYLYSTYCTSNSRLSFQTRTRRLRCTFSRIRQPVNLQVIHVLQSATPYLN